MRGLILKGGLALGLALLSLPAFAQYGSARGKALDEKGLGLPDVAVKIEYQGGTTRVLETKTNKKGEFTQVGLSPGVYRFTFTKDGFQGTYIEMKISLGEATELPEVTLKPGGKAAAATQQKAADELREAFKKAVDLQNAGQLDQAEAALKELGEKNPSIPEIPLRLGQLYEQKKDLVAAEASLKKALEINPDLSDAIVELAGIYQRTGQKEKAAELMSKAAATGGEDPNVQLNLGITSLNGGNYDAAMQAFEKAVQLRPDLAEAYFHMSTIHLNKGQTPDAIQDLEKYLSLNPSNAQNVATAKALLQALKK